MIKSLLKKKGGRKERGMYRRLFKMKRILGTAIYCFITAVYCFITATWIALQDFEFYFFQVLMTTPHPMQRM
jgi:hypothetical protein